MPQTPASKFGGWRKSRRHGADSISAFLAIRPGNIRAPHRAPDVPLAAMNTSLPSAKSRIEDPSNSGTLPGIALRTSLPAGWLPSAVVAGDFNGDGKLDWIVAAGGDNCLFLYFGNGDGTSQLPVMLPLTGKSPVALATADLNGDGKLDLVVVEADTQTIGILFGKGDGTFGAEIELPALSTGPLSVAISDLNKDGKLDLVVGVESNPPDIPGPLVTLLGDGSGHFSAPIPAPNGNGLSDQNGAGVSVADVNGDGIPDVLSTGIDEAGGSSQIFIGKGDGSFSAGETLYQLGGRLNDFVENGILADVTGDGCPDAVVGDSVTTIHIFPGNCAGQFDKTTSYQIYGMGDPIFGMAVADINGDGKPDLIIGGFPYVPLSGSGPVAGNLLGVRLNDGTGHFGQLKVFAGDPGIYSLVVADLKGTGRPEIITANQNSGSVTVYSNDGSGGFGDPQGGYLGTLDGSGTGPANSGFTDFLLADLDGTGRPDILQIQFPPRFSSNPYQLAVVQNQGGGNFSVPVRTDTFDTNTIIRDFTTGNFRNTGKLDFLAEVTDPANSSVSGFAFAPYLGGGKFGVLSFIPFPALAPDELVSGIAVGDFNHDGKLDFLAIAQDNTQGNSFRMLLYLGNGDGTFRQTLQPLTGPALANPNPPCISRIIRPLPIYVEDANGDGKLDLLLWVNGVYKFLGNGDGTFQSPSYLFPFVPEMAVGDLNHDGLLDFVHLSGCPTESTTLNIFLGEGNGGVSSPALYHPFSGVEAEFNGATSGSSAGYFGQVIGDMNGDGNPDLAVFQILATTLPPYLQFLVGHGDGTFSPTLDIFQLGESGIPLFAVHNLLGDQSTSYLYEDSLGSSYIILPSAPAPAFQLQMDETPVAGSQDGLQITLNVPSSSATSFQITASDPAIQITGSATIPAGQTSVNVPFVILSSFNRLKVFSIAVQTGSESYTSYNYVSPSGANSALELIVEPPGEQ